MPCETVAVGLRRERTLLAITWLALGVGFAAHAGDSTSRVASQALCQWLLRESPGFVAQVEEKMGLPKQGFIDEADESRVNLWLRSPESLELRKAAGLLKGQQGEAEIELRKAQAQVFSLPTASDSSAAEPQDAAREKEIRVFWTSEWMKELILASSDLQAEATHLLKSKYRESNTDDYLNFLVELNRPENLEKRAWLTNWAQSVKFRLAHTRVPSGTSRKEALKVMAAVEFKRATAPRSVLNDHALKGHQDQIDAARAKVREGVLDADLRDFADHVNEIARGNQRRLKSNDPDDVLTGRDIDYYMGEFIEMGVQFLAVAEWASEHSSTAEEELIQLIHEKIIDPKLDRMGFKSDEQFRVISEHSPELARVFNSVRQKLLEFAGPY